MTDLFCGDLSVLERSKRTRAPKEEEPQRDPRQKNIEHPDSTGINDVKWLALAAFYRHLSIADIAEHNVVFLRSLLNLCEIPLYSRQSLI